MDISTMASTANYASINNSQGLIGLQVLGMTMQKEAMAAASLVGELMNMPPPAGINEIGGLMDIKV